MRFCSECGEAVVERIPEGDNRLRHVCPGCDAIHYQNPKVVTGCLITAGERILLCKRAIRPRYGYWTVPAGFMENGETAEQGAQRETWEEAKARVAIDALYATFNLPHIDQVYMLYRGRLLGNDFGPGEESLEVELFDESEVPWAELAFPVVAETLKLFFADRAAGSLRSHSGDILRETGRGLRQYQVRLLD